MPTDLFKAELTQHLISAHGNSIRALAKHLNGIIDEDIMGLNIPTGIPLVYQLDDEPRAKSYYHFEDWQEALSKRGIESKIRRNLTWNLVGPHTEL